jgi:phage terminase large subunit-like protein
MGFRIAGPQTSYPDWGVPWFSSIPPDKCLGITLTLTTIVLTILSFDPSVEVLTALLSK